MEPPFYGKVMVVSWFNAGVRVIDVRDPFNMAEVAYYIPATTERTAERCATIDGVETCQVAIQTNNVEVDDRGLIYLADRADTGLAHRGADRPGRNDSRSRRVRPAETLFEALAQPDARMMQALQNDTALMPPTGRTSRAV